MNHIEKSENHHRIRSFVGSLEIALGIFLIGYCAYWMVETTSHPEVYWEGWEMLGAAVAGWTGLGLAFAGIGLIWLKKRPVFLHIPLALWVAVLWIWMAYDL